MTKLLGTFQDLKRGKQLRVCIYNTSRNMFDGVKIPNFYERAEVNPFFLLLPPPQCEERLKMSWKEAVSKVFLAR